MALRALLVCLVCAFCWTLGLDLQAKPNATGAAKSQAKALFRTGVIFFNNGDVERALDYFRQSQTAFASVQNTTNVALCLEKLGRFGEALEVFEQLIAEYRQRLTSRERANIGPKLKKLRGRLGSLKVRANVVALLVVDGRSRGRLPRSLPLRLSAGTHELRIVAEGYAGYKRVVRVKQGSETNIEARLKALRDVGQLRLEDAANVGARVYVDGVGMGRLPWQGTLAPGPHVVRTEQGDVGSAPQQVVVVAGQRMLVAVSSEALGAPLDVRVEPRQAAILVGDVQVGRGTWRGRLPVGEHRFAFREPGYVTQKRTLRVVAKPQNNKDVAIKLVVDREHPRWPKSLAGTITLDVSGGYGFARSMRGDSKDNCIGSCSFPSGAHGVSSNVRLGYRFRSDTALELEVGYRALWEQAQRRLHSSTAGLEYSLEDRILARGPQLALGLSQTARLPKKLLLTGRLAFGVWFSQASNTIDGFAEDGAEKVPLEVEAADQRQQGVPLFLASEVALQWRLKRFRLGLGLRASLFLTAGPLLADRRLVLPPPPASCFGSKDAAPVAACSKTAVSLPDERAQAMFLAAGPALTMGYDF